MTGLRREPFGEVEGQPVERYELSSDHVTVGVLTYGATLHSVLLPDAEGAVADVALGFDDITGYTGVHPYFGSVVGRFANRIARGTFELVGRTYRIPVNQEPNSLHGGTEGFNRRIWTALPLEEADAAGVELALTSGDGDMGFPGTLQASITYLLRGHDLTLRYAATTDRPTVVNLTNHVYFNLAGNGNGTVEDHMMLLAADRFTPVDQDLIPTGELAAVDGTPMDFRAGKRIGEHLRSADTQLVTARGYDHNWVIQNAPSNEVVLAARVQEPTRGRVLEVWTDQPGVQFYSGNFLDGSLVGKGGCAYRQGDGFCLETQHFPDSPNRPHFPSTVLRPGETYTTTTRFRFSSQSRQN